MTPQEGWHEFLDAAARTITAAAAAERERLRAIAEDEYGLTLARELCRKLLGDAP